VPSPERVSLTGPQQSAPVDCGDEAHTSNMAILARIVRMDYNFYAGFFFMAVIRLSHTFWFTWSG
jgi:hypothetical protein